MHRLNNILELDHEGDALIKSVQDHFHRLSMIGEVSPPGWSGSVKAMKKHKEISNPFALAWYMKNKGDHPHYKPEKKQKTHESAPPEWYEGFLKSRTEHPSRKDQRDMALGLGTEHEDPSEHDDSRYSDDAIQTLAKHNRQQQRLKLHKERIQSIRSRFGRG